MQQNFFLQGLPLYHVLDSIKVTNELGLGSVCLSYLCKINGTKTVWKHMKEMDMKL